MTAPSIARTAAPAACRPGRRPRRPIRILLAASAAAVLGSAWIATANNAQAAVPTPHGWAQVFADDFTGPANSRINTGHWRYDTGTGYPGGPQNGFGTGEVETMTDSTANVALDGNGNLRITALRGGPTGWTSGRIETNRTDFQPPAGGKLRVEARLRLPQVANPTGYWPAFWMLGAPYRGVWWNWPSVGEIDIMENVNGLNRAWGTLHCGVINGGPCNEKNGLGANLPCAGTTCQGGFHTYAVEWDRSTSPQQIRWYLDGNQYYAVTSAQMDAGTWNAATGHGFFLILNLAIGGEFPAALGGTPTGSSGGSMRVDYVGVWSAGGAAPPPGGSSPPPGGGTPPQAGNRDAYTPISAASYNDQAGLSSLAVSEGGQGITGAGNGDWAVYKGVNFGGTAAHQFIARVASGAAPGVSGLVEVRLDSRTSPPVGSFAVANTGGWQSWRTVPGNISAVTGTHDVYVTFTSGQPADYVNVNWFTFGH